MTNPYCTFQTGHWTRTQPNKPGMYPVCAVGLEHTSNFNMKLVVQMQNGQLFVPTEWNGWWWSEPIPENFGLPLVEDNVQLSDTTTSTVVMPFDEARRLGVYEPDTMYGCFILRKENPSDQDIRDALRVLLQHGIIVVQEFDRRTRSFLGHTNRETFADLLNDKQVLVHHLSWFYRKVTMTSTQFAQHIGEIEVSTTIDRLSCQQH